jgi:hypothetical protein
MSLRCYALAALVPAGLFAAHDFGGDYDKARLVATTSIEIDAGKVLSISDNAIHWRADLFEAVKSGSTKQYFGENAWLRKVGVAKVPAAMTLGGQPIGAGEWEVFAKVPGDDTSKFILEWKQGATTVDVPLSMKGGNDIEDHLLLALTPRGGAASKEFQLKVFYGDMKASVPGTFAPAKAQ